MATLRHPRGFTLFEILVILALIGIMLGVIAPRLSQRRGVSARTESTRLAALLRAARNQAILSGHPFMVRPSAHAYAFLEMNHTGAFVPARGRLFRTRTLPATAQLVGYRRHAGVVFSPSGLASSFRWLIITPHSRWLVRGMANGRVVAHAA